MVWGLSVLLSQSSGWQIAPTSCRPWSRPAHLRGSLTVWLNAEWEWEGLFLWYGNRNLISGCSISSTAPFFQACHSHSLRGWRKLMSKYVQPKWVTVCGGLWMSVSIGKYDLKAGRISHHLSSVTVRSELMTLSIVCPFLCLYLTCSWIDTWLPGAAAATAVENRKFVLLALLSLFVITPPH